MPGTPQRLVLNAAMWASLSKYFLLSLIFFRCLPLFGQDDFMIKKLDQEAWNSEKISELNDYLYVLADHLDKYDIQKVSDYEFKSRFKKFSSLKKSFSSQTSYWGRLSLENALNISQEWILYTGWNDYVEVYISDSIGFYKRKRSGELLRGDQKDIEEGKLSKVGISLKPREKKIIFIKIKRTNQETPEFQLELLKPRLFYAGLNIRNLIQGFFQGILFMFFIYSLTTFLLLRDWAYLYYGIYLFFSSIYFLHYFNLSAELLFPNYPKLNAFLWLSSFLIHLSYLAFARTFLNIKEALPKAYSLLQLLIQFGLLVFFLNLIYYIITFDFVNTLVINLLLITSYIFFSLLFVVYLIYHRVYLGKFIAFGSFGLIFCGTLSTISYLVFQFREGIYLIQIGIIFEILCFATGLAYRILYVERAEQISKKMQEMQEMQLSFQAKKKNDIKTRDRKIEVHIQELEQSNQIKNQLFSIISRDLREPISLIEGSIRTLQSNLLDEQEKEWLFQHLGSNIQYTKDLLDNLHHWANSQINQMELEVLSFYPQEVASEILKLIDRHNPKTIEIINEIDPTHQAYADPSMYLIVLRNLINNAIKFSHPASKIYLKTTWAPSHIITSVKDEGVGMSTDRLEKLFQTEHRFSTLGTSREKGNGLGLILCKDLVEKNRGRIWAESIIHEGSCFFFSLPTTQDSFSKPPVYPKTPIHSGE